MNYQQGDIVLIPVPFTDNQSFKVRPALVISNQTIHKHGDVLIVQITSKFKDDGLNVLLSEGDTNPQLPVKSYIRTYKLFVLEKQLVIKKIAVLSTAKYQELITAIIKNINP